MVMIDLHSQGPMRAVAFGPASMDLALRELPRLRSAGAECVEMRLDLFDEPYDLAALLSARGDLPTVVTLRPTDQGGRSQSDAEARFAVLRVAAELGAEYVDVEYDALTPARLSALRAAGARVIVSRHDFSGMPPLTRWWSELAASGADVVKVVGTAHGPSDVLEVVRVLRQADRPAIALAMGAAGVASRILALREPRCLLTFAALDDATGTAPGQVTLQDMDRLYRATSVGSRTRVYGLLGPHVEPDRLADYSLWFAEAGMDAIAVPFPFESPVDAARVLREFETLPIWGWHVHGADLQVQVRRALGRVSDPAEAQGRVNAIVRTPDGTLCGDVVTSPRQQFDLWRANAA